MKKLLVTLLTSAMALSFIGCGSSTQPTEPTQPKEVIEQQLEQQEKVENKIEKKQEAQESDPSEILDMFKLEYTLQAPDAIGNVYAEGTFTNNTASIVENITYVFNYTNAEGKKDTTHLMFVDTVLPLESSAISTCFGSEDMKLIEVQVQWNFEGQTHYTVYNAKTNTLNHLY